MLLKERRIVVRAGLSRIPTEKLIIARRDGGEVIAAGGIRYRRAEQVSATPIHGQQHRLNAHDGFPFGIRNDAADFSSSTSQRDLEGAGNRLQKLQRAVENVLACVVHA